MMACKCNVDFGSAFCPHCGEPHEFKSTRTLLAFMENKIRQTERVHAEREAWWKKHSDQATDYARDKREPSSIRRLKLIAKYTAWRDWVQGRMTDEERKAVHDYDTNDS